MASGRGWRLDRSAGSSEWQGRLQGLAHARCLTKLDGNKVLGLGRDAGSREGWAHLVVGFFCV